MSTAYRLSPVLAPTLAALLAAGALAGGATSAAATPVEPDLPRYTLQVLEPLPGGTSHLALGSSRAGVVGTSRTGPDARPQHAALWHEDHVHDLGTLPGSTFSRAFAVNRRGQVVGEAFTAPPEVSRAVMWEPDGTIRDLGTLGGAGAVANDVDDLGRAYGVSSPVSGSSTATVWDRRGARALPLPDPGAPGASRVNAVTASGDAVGAAPVRSSGTTTTQPVRWDTRGLRHVPTVLPPLEETRFATALGVDGDVVVGEASRLDPGTARTSTRAVRWEDGKVEELAPLGSYRFTRATDVSPDGYAVGFASGFAGFPSIDGSAVLWTEDEAVDLETVVVDLPDGLQLRNAESVDDEGRISGFGTTGGRNVAVLLVPLS
ncbi:hypothetical protein [Aquipuribacter sp. MA13-6]|uniref:hypothetical protein n=1 Tax=unclassified Aquipuribacter TaxID=2635084 RepID=UPI003EE9B544